MTMQTTANQMKWNPSAERVISSEAMRSITNELPVNAIPAEKVVPRKGKPSQKLGEREVNGRMNATERNRGGKQNG